MLLEKIRAMFVKRNLKKKSRWKEGEYFTSRLFITTGLPLLLRGSSRSVLSSFALRMEINTFSPQVPVAHLLQFSLWKPSYLLTESICTKT